MSEHIKLPATAVQQDAIDVNDFVYAATGSRIRRLTMPDGTHWFPAADLLGNLGYTNPSKTLADHVSDQDRISLETLTTRYGTRVPAGQGFKKTMSMVNLSGLIMLVTGATKPETRPFKRWVAEVILTVQSEGSYSLQKAEVQPAAPAAPTAYAMPAEVAEAIVRLEERSLRLDEALVVTQREAQETRRDMARSQERLAGALDRIGDALDALLSRQAPLAPAPVVEPPRVTAEAVLAEWKPRLSLTEDVWAVAVVIAPVLAEHGEIRQPLESIAARTGLSTHRVNECLRFMRKHACIRAVGGTPEGSPVYALNRL